MKHISDYILESAINNIEVHPDEILFVMDGKEVGKMTYYVMDVDRLDNEMSDSIEDFDSDILKKFDYFKPIVSIEDVYIKNQYQDKGLFKEFMKLSMNELSKKYKQFILRAHGYGKLSDKKLESIYSNYFGFKPLQETDSEGIIMGKF